MGCKKRQTEAHVATRTRGGTDVAKPETLHSKTQNKTFGLQGSPSGASMKVPALAGFTVSSRVSSHINAYVDMQLSRVRTRHTRTGACIRNRNATTEAARTVGLAPLRRTLMVSGARTNPGTWTGPAEPYVPSHPAYGSRLCDSFSTAEHHFPPRNKSGIYAFFWMGLHEVVLGVLGFFFLRVF